MASVLRSASQNSGLENSTSKLPNPIHSLCRNDSIGLSPANGL